MEAFLLLPPHPIPDRGDRPGRRSGRPQPPEASGLYSGYQDIVWEKISFCVFFILSAYSAVLLIRIHIRIGSPVPGSGSGFARILIQENKNDPQK
jgi:hypothetical protein